MYTEKFMFSGSDGVEMHALLHLPDESPRLTIQIVHGMTEHIARYEKLAQQLTARGAAVIGFDMRGHGANAGDQQIASFGENGWAKTLDDMNLFFEAVSSRFEGLPHFMLGFSLGSFLLREYLEQHSSRVAGAVLLGSGHQSAPVLGLMRAVVKREIAKCGFDSTTPLVRKLSFETYNRKFQPNRTRADWLCSDEAQLDEYIADPLCRSDISAGLFWELLGSMQRTGRREACALWRKDMPVLLLSGQNDPVGDCGKGVWRIDAALRSAGMTNVRMRLFPGARHDLFHEEENGTAEAVRTLIAEWLAEQAHHYESLHRSAAQSL